MRRLTAIICALFALCLSLPSMAADNASPERKVEFGGLTVHYNAFASGILTPQVAAATDLIRSKGQGVLSIAAIKGATTVPVTISGSVKDLTGRDKPLSFRQINDNGTVSYIAQFVVDPDTTGLYTFTVNVKAADEEAHAFSFNQEIYSGE